MKKYTIILFLFLCLFFYYGNSFSQVSFNMYLLANLNQHFTNTLYSACWGYVSSSGREYAILGCPSGTAFIDITDTSNIHEVDFLPGLTSSWREMKVYGDFAYIVSEATGSGLQIVNLKYLPDSVSLIRTFTFSGYSRTHTISQSGPYLYLNGGNYQQGGVFVLDLTSNPTLPVLRGAWEVEYVHDCRVVNDTIWAADIFDDNISVINALNKDNLTTITQWQNLPNPFPHNCALTTDRRYILTTDETTTPPGRLKVWNIENLANVTFVTSWQPTGITTSTVHNVEIYGNYALVAHYTAGIRVVNISNPATPTEAGWYDTYPLNNNTGYSGCWGVFMFPSGKIIGSDRQTGLYVVKTNFTIVGVNQKNSIPKNYSLKQNYPNPFNPTTTIEYSLPKSGYITLKVYDLLGNEAANLVSEFSQAGNHKVNYDASRLSSGVYFYILKTNDYTETKKMTLLK